MKLFQLYKEISSSNSLIFFATRTFCIQYQPFINAIFMKEMKTSQKLNFLSKLVISITNYTSLLFVINIFKIRFIVNSCLKNIQFILLEALIWNF